MTAGDLRPDTLTVTAGRAASGASLAPALWASSTWASADLADAQARSTAVRPLDFYSRYANPTVRDFERAVAAVEGAEDALAFASGMGAIASVVLALCGKGDHVVAQRQLYSGTTAFLAGVCPRFGIEVTFVDGTEPGAFAAAVRPGRTMLVVAETPSNPLLDLVDLDELGAIRGPFTLVDATFATPLGQRTLAHGVDLVLHSATKGIAGHNDATLGVVAGEAELLASIWAYGVLHGATPSPFDALNALRGLRTLGVRLERQVATASRLADELAGHRAVSFVRYPFHPSHPHVELARRQQRSGGTLVAFELHGGRPAAEAFLSALRIARVATSLGGPETLVCHPATSTHAALSRRERAEQRITDGLLRCSVGLEATDDVVADLLRAADAAHAAGTDAAGPEPAAVAHDRTP